jgi:hypothetical protein
LNKCVGKEPSNHTVFLILGGRNHDEPIMVQFCDAHAYFGKRIVEYAEGP